jgi:WD40 repeat protein
MVDWRTGGRTETCLFFLLCSSGEDGYIWIYDTKTGKLVHVFSGEDSSGEYEFTQDNMDRSSSVWKILLTGISGPFYYR